MKIRKRILAFIMSLAMILSAVSAIQISTFAETVESGTCGADGDNLTWTLDDEGTLTISGTGAMKNYSYYDAPWYNSRSSIKCVTIGNGVTSIGIGAFYNCSSLTSITVDKDNTIYDSRNNCNAIIETATNTLISGCKNTIIPDGVTNIDLGAFYGCAGLESITIPSSVTSIDDSAFCGCTSLTSITIPYSVTRIGSSPFSDCSSLTSITIDKDNTIYDSRNNCNAIIETATNTLISGCKNTIIPDGVTNIDLGAFYGCTGLESITIPSSVTSIDDSAFYGCTSLTSITIPSSVTSIYGLAFSGCVNLASINVDERNITYDSRNNCNAIIETATNTLIYGCKNTIIPDSVTSIGILAFLGCTGLVNITIPKSVTSIGLGAFLDCNNLTDISIPDDVTTIGKMAFMACQNLTNATFGKNSKLKDLGSSAFSHCLSLTSITIPKGEISIGESAFSSCSSLTSITIPDSVTCIGDWAFGYCTSLTSITIPDSVTSICDYAFGYCSSLKDVYYSGSKDDRNNIKIGSDNDALLNATWHYNSTGSLLSVKDKATGIEISYNPDCFNQAINLHVEKVDINKVDEKIIGDNEIKGMDIEYLYNIYPEYNGKIVQPNGKVLVRIPTPENADTSKIKIFHYFTGENNQLTKITIKNSEINFKDGYMEFYVSHFSTFAVCTEKATGITNVKLNVAAATAVDYRSKVTIKATATGVPSNSYLAIYVNGKQVAKGDNKEVSYMLGEAKSDINYTVKVVDANGNVQKNTSGKDIAKDSKITCNAGFFKKLIAFFKGLFGMLPIVTIKP